MRAARAERRPLLGRIQEAGQHQFVLGGGGGGRVAIGISPVSGGSGHTKGARLDRQGPEKKISTPRATSGSLAAMRRLALAAWAALVLSLPGLEAARARGDGDWEFIDDDDGIHTWRKDLGEQRAAFRGQAFIRGTIEDVLAPILDSKHHTEWMYGVKESTLLEQLSPTRVLVYVRVKGIWPVWDRDAISESELQWSADHKHLVIRGHSVPSNRRPVPERVVRMPLLKGTMKMWQVAAQNVKVLYDIEADLGGRIPAWIARMASKEIPYHTLRNLRDRVQGKK